MKITSVLLLCLSLYLVAGDELSDLISRKNAATVSAAGSVANSNKLATSLLSAGNWSDVDYTSGCPASTSTWGALQHWNRIYIISMTWYQNKNATLLTKVRSAMNWWFNQDYGPTHSDCTRQNQVYAGGNCPCGTPGLWNKNWFFMQISLPKSYSGPTCLLLLGGGAPLTSNENYYCQLLLQRGYSTVANATGSNIQDQASVGTMLGLFNGNLTQVREAYEYIFESFDYVPGTDDGIKVDGTYFQHGSMPYIGAYGQIFLQDAFSSLNLTSGYSDFLISNDEQAALNTMIAAGEWSLYYRKTTGTYWWDLSQIGRSAALGFYVLSLPFASMRQVISYWSAQGALTTVNRLTTSPAGTAGTTNYNGLVGNRYFYESDYMAHRGSNYVITLKMLSTRTRTGECVNGQGLKSLHLSDGIVFNYVSGDEYLNAAPLWNGYYLPGITVDPASHTLSCASTTYYGNKTFVGGASDGTNGVAAMDFVSPFNRQLSWKKSWVFFADAYVTFVYNITQTTGSPVTTVIDNRVQNGTVTSDSGASSGIYTNPSWIHHDNIGYVFPQAIRVNVSTAVTSGSWSSIGTTVGNVSQSMFLAQAYPTTGSNQFVYYTVPGVTKANFNAATYSSALSVVQFDDSVHAVQHSGQKAYGITFWKASSTTLTTISTTVSTNQPAVLLYGYTSTSTHTITVSDPTQQLSTITIQLSNTSYQCPTDASVGSCTKDGSGLTITVNLPAGDFAGQSATLNLATA